LYIPNEPGTVAFELRGVLQQGVAVLYGLPEISKDAIERAEVPLLIAREGEGSAGGSRILNSFLNTIEVLFEFANVDAKRGVFGL